MTPESRGAVNVTSVPDIPALLPILPLRETVAFPLALLPLAVGQERSIRLVDDVMRTTRLLGLVAQRKPEAKAATAEDLYEVGCAAVIQQMMRGENGTIRAVVQGLERVRIKQILQTEPYLIARVEKAPEIASPGTETDAQVRTLRSLFERLAALNGVPKELNGVVQTIDDPIALAYLVAGSVPLSTADRQAILEADSSLTKLRRLIELLQHEIAVGELEEKITSETREKISKSQRDYMLREQMKTIQKQLGEEDGDGSELQELRKSLDEARFPEEVRSEAEREYRRLAQMPPGSPESGMVRTYLDWLVGLPWGKTTGRPIDVARARQILDEDHYDLEKIKDRILDYLAVQKLKSERVNATRAPNVGPVSSEDSPLPITAEDESRREPILCLVGPPGVGKTSLGQSIARAMERKFVRISLGGVHDESEIRGHRRTYIGSLPGRIIQALRRAQTMDPVFMLDEVDKLSASFHGDPAAALLEVLDPAQNNTFTDTYLGVPFDLSKVLFICTANTVETIPPPLLDRLEVLTLSGYTEEEKRHIARRYLLPKQIRANGLFESEFVLDDDGIRRIIQEYTREAGVRSLEREIGTVARKAARQITEGANPPIHVTAELIPQFLGRRRFYNDLAERTDRPGIATGLAWTPSGGEVLFVEAAMIPGKDHLILTGMLGDVMRESAQAALSFVRSSAARLGIDSKVFEGKTIHVHVPAGSIPKDGPSAGVTMAVAIASLAKGTPVRNDTAMTGEITLRGKVLPVGGIREKVLAAYRAGVKKVILPQRNRDALEDVPEEIRKTIQFTFAEAAEQVIDAALGNAETAGAGPPERQRPERRA